MNKTWLLLAACCAGATAQAQESEFGVSVGLRAWYAQWTTFSYYVDPATNQNAALTQSTAASRLIWIPTLSARYGPWSASFSGSRATGFEFADGGGSGTRREYDLNLGYNVLPGLGLTVGYKRMSQRDGNNRYEPAGPVIGVNANAPLEGALSFYGNLGLGRLKSGSSSNVHFDADYRLTELGLAWTMAGGAWVRSWAFTGGYRMQVMSSKEAFGSQDGRDSTQGFTLGAVASF